MDPQQSPPATPVPTQIHESSPSKSSSLLPLWILLSFLIGIGLTLLIVHFYPSIFEDLGVIKEKKVVAEDNGTDGIDKEKTLEEKYPGKVAYEYSYKGKDYVLMMDNSENLESEVNNGCLTIYLDTKSKLGLCLTETDTTKAVEPVAYFGETLRRIVGNVYRNTYFSVNDYVLELTNVLDREALEGYSFCLPVSEKNELPELGVEASGCVAKDFHYGPEGALNAIILDVNATRTSPDSDWSTNGDGSMVIHTPTETAIKLADDMIASYKIEEVK